MDIKSIADLGKLAATCRKHGIKTIKLGPDGIEFSLGDKPLKKRRGNPDAPAIEPGSIMPTYTEEELLNWSSDVGV